MADIKGKALLGSLANEGKVSRGFENVREGEGNIVTMQSYKDVRNQIFIQGGIALCLRERTVDNTVDSFHFRRGNIDGT
jgi:hypothetical protein